MRIALIAPLWATVPPVNYGGIELILDLLCQGFLERGHEVTLFASGDCHTQARLHPVIPKNLSQLMSDGSALISEYYTSAVLAEALQRQDEFDLFHAHLPLAWLPLAALSRRPCLFSLHTSIHTDDLWVLGRYPESPVAAISQSQIRAVRETLHRELPVIPNAINFANYKPALEAGKYLVFLGRMSPEKNPLDAIRIALRAEMPLMLAGVPQGKKEETYFHEKIEPLIDGKNICWLGPVNHTEKVSLLSNAAALLFPIDWEEPFGLVMIEAMACGTPVLAIGRGAVPEVVDPGLTGYIGANSEELSALLSATLELDRRKVRQTAAARFDATQMVENYLTLYRSF